MYACTRGGRYVALGVRAAKLPELLVLYIVQSCPVHFQLSKYVSDNCAILNDNCAKNDISTYLQF